MRRKAYRQPTFWLLLVSFFVVGTASSGIVLHLMLYITEQGISSGSAAGIISVFTASGAVSTVAHYYSAVYNLLSASCRIRIM